jgi:hypothetical protein
VNRVLYCILGINTSNTVYYGKILELKLGKLPINSFLRQLGPMTLMDRHKQATNGMGVQKLLDILYVI